MYRHASIIAVTIVLTSVSCSGPAPTSDDHPSVSGHDRELQEKWDAWYQRQVSQDCPPGPYDERAIEAVRRAHKGDKRQFVYGPNDPYDRRTPVLQNLKTRLNPRGEGILVTAWEDSSQQGLADFSRKRSVWLFLDGEVYPVNQNAANDLGRLYDGMPDDIQIRAGIRHSYERGQTMMDQLGIEEQAFERRFSGVNPFPMCE